MIEYTLLNILISELKMYCGPDKFYGWSKFGQYDEVNNRAPYMFMSILFQPICIVFSFPGVLSCSRFYYTAVVVSGKAGTLEIR